jgi:ribonuclease HI
MDKFAQQFKITEFRNRHYTDQLSKNELIYFTDGSASANGKANAIAGFAVICVNGYKKNTITFGKLKNEIKPTNIRAEGTAILEILNELLNDVSSSEWKAATIYSDSEFWINMLCKYMPKWSPTKFTEKANADMTIPMWNIWKTLQKSDKHVNITHVYAHNKTGLKESLDPYDQFTFSNNDLADVLAGIAHNMPDTVVHTMKL